MPDLSNLELNQRVYKRLRDIPGHVHTVDYLNPRRNSVVIKTTYSEIVIGSSPYRADGFEAIFTTEAPGLGVHASLDGMAGPACGEVPAL